MSKLANVHTTLIINVEPIFSCVGPTAAKSELHGKTGPDNSCDLLKCTKNIQSGPLFASADTLTEIFFTNSDCCRLLTITAPNMLYGIMLNSPKLPLLLPSKQVGRICFFILDKLLCMIKCLILTTKLLILCG